MNRRVGCPEWGYVSADELMDLNVNLGGDFSSIAEVDESFEPDRFGELGRHRDG